MSFFWLDSLRMILRQWLENRHRVELAVELAGLAVAVALAAETSSALVVALLVLGAAPLVRGLVVAKTLQKNHAFSLDSVDVVAKTLQKNHAFSLDSVDGICKMRRKYFQGRNHLYRLILHLGLASISGAPPTAGAVSQAADSPALASMAMLFLADPWRENLQCFFWQVPFWAARRSAPAPTAGAAPGAISARTSQAADSPRLVSPLLWAGRRSDS